MSHGKLVHSFPSLENSVLPSDDHIPMLEIGPIGFPKLETDSTRKQLRKFGNGFSNG
jgi:hypothetical protein